MTELVLVLSEFYGLGADVRPDGWSRLPLLETWLSRASVTHQPDDWRGWVAARCAPAPLWAFSLASIASAAFRGASTTRPESTGYWLATPVHLFAGLDSVQIHPNGLLQLTDEEQAALVSDFARVFSDSPWRIQSLRQRELLLSGLQIDASAADPSRLLGLDPTAGLPRGEGAAVLRRLGSEIEMWLYEHPVNRARELRGELVVNALWLWGNQPPIVPAKLPSSLRSPRLFGHDIYLQALWRLQQRQVEQVSAALSAIDAQPLTLRSDSVWLYSGAFTELEQRLMPSLMRAIRRRQLATLTLVAGAHLYTLSAARLLRVWRRCPPWWESLA